MGMHVRGFSKSSLRTPIGMPSWMLTSLTAALSLPANPSIHALAAAKATGSLSLWDSVRPRSRQVAAWELKLFFPQRSDGDMQRQLGLRSQADQDKTLRAVSAVSVAGICGATLIEGSALPVSIRTGLTSVAALAPFATLIAGVALPDVLQRALMAVWRLDPKYRRRQAYHEAGHLLIGMLLGLQIVSYNAASPDGNGAAVRLSPPDARSWDASRGLVSDSDEAAAGAACEDALLDALLVLSMGGVAAEVLACGDAEGGVSDVAQARCFLERKWSTGVQSAPTRRTARAKQDDRIRWATLFALTLLQRHRASLDAVVEAFDEGADVGACLCAAQNAAALDDMRLSGAS